MGVSDRGHKFGVGDNPGKRAGHAGAEGTQRLEPRGWRGLWLGAKHANTNLSLWLCGDFWPWSQVIERVRSTGSPPSGTGNGEFVWNPASKSNVDQRGQPWLTGRELWAVTLGGSFPQSGPQCPLKWDLWVPPALTLWFHILALVLGSFQR